MGYQTLYRKYRPKNFDDVYGQSSIIKILKNAITNNKITHAYLFFGPRGTGKTSIAKILARTINCECLDNLIPCEKCKSCSDSITNGCVDIVEIDAASNNGVDEIRELKSKINIVPSTLRYKVYIIDEVHMLSIGAFNALLKTIEEPPAHVIFILATTELNKVPTTILSRCQMLEFSKLSIADISECIKKIVEKEKINIEEEAIVELASIADGGMRDALVLLDKMASYTTNITKEDVLQVCGKTPLKYVEDFIKSIIENNMQKSLEIIEDIYCNNYDLIYFLESVIKKNNEYLFGIKDKKIVLINSELIKLYDALRVSAVPKNVFLETGLVKIMLEFSTHSSGNLEEENTILDDSNTIEIVKEVKTVEKVLKSDKEAINEVKKEQKFDYNDLKKIRINNTFVNAEKKELNATKEVWKKLQDYAFDKKIGSKVCSLLDGIPVAASDNYVIIEFQYQAAADKVNEDFFESEKLLAKILDLNKFIVALSREEWNKAKKEYLNNINNGGSYVIIEDIYISENNTKKEKVPKKSETKNSEITEKALELFDSMLIEIE